MLVMRVVRPDKREIISIENLQARLHDGSSVRRDCLDQNFGQLLECRRPDLPLEGH